MKNRSKILAAAVASTLAGVQSTIAATIIVNSTIDAITGTGPGVCTLRQAISSANQDMLSGDCVVGSDTETDHVEFAQALSGSTITLTEGAINIASPLVLGPSSPTGSQVTISGGNSSGIFRISNNVNYDVIDVTLRGLTLTNGVGFSNRGGAVSNYLENVTIEACTLTGNTVTQDGGAIYNRGEMTLVDSVVTGNSAMRDGGGAYSRGHMTLIDSSISGNSSTEDGGGVYNQIGFLTLINSIVSDNTSGEDGGGIHSRGSLTMGENIVTVEGGSLSSNTATRFGGGIYSRTSSVSLTNVTVDRNYSREGGGIYSTNTIINGGQLVGNTAGVAGGGMQAGIGGVLESNGTQFLYNVTAGAGGALATLTAANLHITDGTFRGNTAGFGGAISGARSVTLLNSTVVNNTAENAAAIFTQPSFGIGSLVMTNTTVSGNTATSTDSRQIPVAVLSRADVFINASTLLGNAPAGIAVAGEDASWSMKNSVIADSAVTDCSDVEFLLTENVNNFIGDGSCAFNAVNLLVGDPMLGPLSEAGGSTPAHFPLPGSPLVDAGETSDCPDIDQLGMPRPIDGNANGAADCDIGSIEYVDLMAPLANLTPVSDINMPGAATLLIEVTYTELDGAVDLLTLDPTDISILPGPLTVQSVALAGNPGQVVATYSALPPGGSWDLADNNSYEISILGDAVGDTATTGANFVAAGVLGGFSVAIVDIDVSGAGVSIADGDASPSGADNTAFGEVPLQNLASHAFTITNLGAGVLNLASPLEVLGQGFTISQPADTMLTAGGSTQFQVMFAPTQLGPVTGQVIILSNDSDENPYTFAVSAVGVVVQEEIFADGFELP